MGEVEWRVQRVGDGVAWFDEHRSPAGAAADYVESFVLRGVHVDFVFERLESADDHGRLGPFPETQGGFAGSGSHFARPFDVEVHLFLRFAGVVVHDVRFECVPASRVFRPIAGFGDFAGSNGSSVFVDFRGSSVFNVFCDFRGFCGFHWAGMPPNAQVVAWFHFRNIITADTGNAIGAIDAVNRTLKGDGDATRAHADDAHVRMVQHRPFDGGGHVTFGNHRTAEATGRALFQRTFHGMQEIPRSGIVPVEEEIAVDMAFDNSR